MRDFTQYIYIYIYSENWLIAIVSFSIEKLYKTIIFILNAVYCFKTNKQKTNEMKKNNIPKKQTETFQKVYMKKFK